MSTYKKIDFFTTTAGIETRQALIDMSKDSKFKTDDSYSANAVAYPKGSISFEDKHMNYLRNHPSTNPQQYVSNLRLMTRIR